MTYVVAYAVLITYYNFSLKLALNYRTVAENDFFKSIGKTPRQRFIIIIMYVLSVVGIEILTAVTMKCVVFWVVMHYLIVSPASTVKPLSIVPG
jgi:hypothetical protein